MIRARGRAGSCRKLGVVVRPLDAVVSLDDSLQVHWPSYSDSQWNNSIWLSIDVHRVSLSVQWLLTLVSTAWFRCRLTWNCSESSAKLSDGNVVPQSILVGGFQCTTKEQKRTQSKKTTSSTTTTNTRGGQKGEGGGKHWKRNRDRKRERERETEREGANRLLPWIRIFLLGKNRWRINDGHSTWLMAEELIFVG